MYQPHIIHTHETHQFLLLISFLLGSSSSQLSLWHRAWMQSLPAKTQFNISRNMVVYWVYALKKRKQQTWHVVLPHTMSAPREYFPTGHKMQDDAAIKLKVPG
jgi:hypothetical protein